MSIKDMPAFVLSHKNVKNAVIYSLISCLFLIAQSFLMEKNTVAVVFDIIIPITAAITFGCYAITMAMDRPIILICPPTVYFVSLLIHQLIAVEVGDEDTYPFIIVLEMVPYIFFCIYVATGKLKKATDAVLRISTALLVIASIVIAVLAIFFKIILFHHSVHYMSSTFALICSFFAIIFIYTEMIELLKIAGIEKKKKDTLK